MKKIVFLAATICFTLAYSLGFCYRVDDFRVTDTIPPSELENIFIGTGYNGKFVTAWLDFSDFQHRRVYIKQFRLDGSVAGPEIEPPDIIEQGQRLNNGGGMAILQPNGNIVLVRTMQKDSTNPDGGPYPWHYLRSYVDILDSLGNVIVPSFLVDTLPPALYRTKAAEGLAADTQGNFTVVFYDDLTHEIFFQQFYATGQKRGSLTQVMCDSFDCDAATQHLRLSMNKEGRFIITWDGTGLQVPVAQIYRPDGLPVRAPFVLSCDDTMRQPCSFGLDTSYHCLQASGPTVGIDAAGNFMAAFNACNGDPTGKQVYSRLFDSLGQPLTPNMDIQDLEYTYEFSHRPRVVSTEDGGYMVIWGDKTNYPYNDIWAKRFDSTGRQVGIKYRINNPVGALLNYDFVRAAVSNGHLFVAWQDRRDRPLLAGSFYAQIMPVNEVGVFAPGDVNYDHILSIADVIGIANYIFRGIKYTPEGTPLVCDVNGDCKVNLPDVIYLVNYIFKPGWPAPVGCPTK